MNNVIMRVRSLRKIYFILSPSFLFQAWPRGPDSLNGLDIVDGRQVHHVQGIELIPVLMSTKSARSWI